MQQDKNFTVRLKAAVDKRMKETGIWDLVLEASKHFEEYQKHEDQFMNSLSDITLSYLQGIKTAHVLRNTDTKKRQLFHDRLIGKGISKDVVEKALQVLSEWDEATAVTPSPAKAEQEGPWKVKVEHSAAHPESGCSGDTYIVLTDGRVELYFDGGIDDDDEQLLCNFLNEREIKLDYDHEAELYASQLEGLYKEAYAEVEELRKREPEGLRWVKASERLPENKKMNYLFRQSGNTRSARVIYLDFTPNIVAAMQLPIGNIEWLDESTPATQPDPVAFADALPADQEAFDDAMEAEINKLPYTKHLDDGQYNDGQVAGFELGANWAKNYLQQTKQP